MSHHRRQFSDGSEPLRLDQLFFQALAFTDISPVSVDLNRLTIGITNHPRLFAYPPVSPIPMQKPVLECVLPFFPEKGYLSPKVAYVLRGNMTVPELGMTDELPWLKAKQCNDTF